MGSKTIRNIQKVFKATSGVLFGRKTAGTGRGEELTPSDVRTLLSVYTISQTDTAISTAVNALVAGAPALLDTLDELSAALGDDANFATTVTTALAGKVDSSSLNESIDDRVAALLVAGTNITLTYNDASGSLTIASTGSSGNSFATVQPAINGTSGTAVVADSSTDTLTIDTNCGLVIAGDAASDKLTLDAIGVQSVPYLVNVDTYAAPSGSVGGNLVIAANTLYKIPVRISKRRTITTAAITVQAAGTATAIRLGIRNASVTDGDATTLVQDFGTVSVTTNGTKTIAGLSLDLLPGVYYFEFIADGTATVRAVSAASFQSVLGSQLSGTGSVQVLYLTRSFTYATLPSDETSVEQTLVSAGNVPIFGVR